MKLAKYIELIDAKLETVAAELGVAVSTVSRWANDRATPERQHMERIRQWSGGAVMPADFYSNEIDQ